jgi:PAS domain S-box-containing protein
MDKELRILILEDVPTDAELMEQELHKAGMAFISKRVETREDFFEAIKDSAPDLILADCFLPSFDGLSALAIAQEQCPDVPFIFVTGAIGEDFAIETFKRGGTDYVLKQRLPRLVPAVSRALREAEERVQRKRTEEALWASAREWRTTFDAINDVVILMDLEGKILRCNKAMVKLLKKQFSEIIDHNCCELIHGAPEPITGCPLVRMRETHRRESLNMPAGVRWFNVTVDPLFDQNERIIGAVHIMSDITESKRAEEALKKTMGDLERSNRELEQFAYVASHDLQEPLRMVASYTQLLAKRYQDKLDADANEFIGYAVDGANRMQKMINDLLSYSRVGTRDKPFEAVDCTAIFSQSLNNLEMAIEEAGAMITHDPLPTVMGDESQLVQLFQNLIDNAIKFRGKETPHIHISATHESRKTMDDGRETIDQLRTARLSSPKSQLSELKEGWVFSVRDKGIGIDPQDKERIFTIFQRLHGRDYSGTGIGLSICKRIIERHGGRIWVESEPEKGSTFYFTIPDR